MKSLNKINGEENDDIIFFKNLTLLFIYYELYIMKKIRVTRVYLKKKEVVEKGYTNHNSNAM
jgi:hypothetical protein